MFSIWRLIIIEHRRKKYILWLIVVVFIVALCLPLLNSIALGQGDIVNQSFQHFVIEIVGVLFIVYFWSTLLYEFKEKKTLQLLRSKKKQPLSFIFGTWLGIYSIYACFVIVSLIASLVYYGDTTLILNYINLLISWSLLLSIVFLFSFLTNSYTAMLSSLVIYILGYSINFILFSTPVGFESNISFKIFSIVQYLFPRLDLLYSSIYDLSSRWWAALGNILFSICIGIIMIRVFLWRFSYR